MNKIINKKNIRSIIFILFIPAACWFLIWHFAHRLDTKDLIAAPRTRHVESTVKIVPISSFGIKGDKFMVNGSPAFLLGVSYFDAMNWRSSDFENLANRKFNLVRIWLDWPAGGISADWSDWRRYNGFFDNQGHLIHKKELINLVRSAGKHGIIVDVTILHGSSFGGNFISRENAVRNTVRDLKFEPNVLFDIMNEYRVAGSNRCPPTSSEIRSLISTAKNENSNSILFASSEYINKKGSPIKQNIDTDINVGFSLIAPHLPRTHDWYLKTNQRVTLLKNYLSSKGKKIPIYLQEEHRIGYKKAFFAADDFLLAARASVITGAAGWIFHTAAGFDMSTSDFFHNLSSVEIDIVNSMGDEVFD